MPDAAQPPDPWSLRASDAERDKYLVLLQEAYAEGRLDAVEYDERMGQALSAKTYRELYAVLESLPFDPSRVPGPPMARPSTGVAPLRYAPVAAPGPSAGVLGGFPADTSVVAIFGEGRRNGVWQVPDVLQSLALFGEVSLDLTSAVLPGPLTELRCNAVFGSVKVIVPDALHVEVNGTGILGSFEQLDKRKGADKRRTPAPNAPMVRITGIALFGSVEVRLVVPKPGRPGVSMRSALPPGPQHPQIEGPR